MGVVIYLLIYVLPLPFPIKGQFFVHSVTDHAIFVQVCLFRKRSVLFHLFFLVVHRNLTDKKTKFSSHEIPMGHEEGLPNI